MKKIRFEGKGRCKSISIIEVASCFIALALGAWFSYNIKQFDRLTGQHRIVSMNELVITTMILGSVVAGPLVLSIQYILLGRLGRRKMPSIGELLWLVPSILYGSTWAIFLVLARIWEATPFVALFFLGIQFMCSIMAFTLICYYIIESSTRHELYWTDVFGCISCLSIGGLLTYWVIISP